MKKTIGTLVIAGMMAFGAGTSVFAQDSAAAISETAGSETAVSGFMVTNGGSLALQSGNYTYYLSADDLPDMESGDTVSVTGLYDSASNTIIVTDATVNGTEYSGL